MTSGQRYISIFIIAIAILAALVIFMPKGGGRAVNPLNNTVNRAQEATPEINNDTNNNAGDIGAGNNNTAPAPSTPPTQP